ncbi:Serendipity locus protein alpha-like [Homarus americanus]|uniref:Serendipity locus protein alpha-like n=1 Tax=Homarus americanus TaxID=6706 RepID=A0A8J5MJN7_HOMAM|nr:Serendipity locus protein alpha-like [Homarus americanus]
MRKMDNISDCTKTKSVLNVLGPIANQVVELRGRQGVVCDATTVIKLLKQCQALDTSCVLLVSRLASHALSHKDDVLSSEAKRIKGQLNKVTDSLTDATRDLHHGDVGVRDNDEVWAGIVEDTEQLLSTLTEALLAWDRAQLRRVTQALTHLQQCLCRLEQTHTVHHLPNEFQVVVCASVDLLNLLEVRCEDLYRRAQRETVRLLALQLCHTLPLLASTCAATVTYPLSKHIRGSRELVSIRLQTLLTDLHSHVGLGDAEYDLGEAGSFITCVDNILELLLEAQDKSNSPTSRSAGPHSLHVKPQLEEVLRHGIAVAYCSSPDDNHIIMAMCENALKQLKILVTLERSGSPDAVDVQIACDILADCVELLEQKVNTALIRLIAQTFAAPMTPIESLMELVTSVAGTTDHKTLDTRIMDFDLHVDHIFQVGGFATACTSDETRVRLIRDSLLTLEWLEGCLVPSIVSAYTDPHPNARAHAHMLARHWMVTKQEVHQLWAELKDCLYTQDVAWVEKQVMRVVTFTSRVLALHEKNSFLLDSQLEDLQVAIKEMKRSVEAVVASPTDLSLHRSMIKRVQLTLTLLSRIANSLNEEYLQPDDDVNDEEQHQKKAESKLPHAKLTKTEREQLITSNIKDIPIDVATPVPVLHHQRTSINPQQPSAAQGNQEHLQQKSLKRSSRSTSRLGEVRVRAASSNMSGHHSRSMQAMASETLGCDTSIDITKFLSHSTNTLSSSTRASRRNFTLRVKEINLDMDGALVMKASVPSHHSTHSKMGLPEGHARAFTTERKAAEGLAEEGEMCDQNAPGMWCSSGEDQYYDSRLKEVSDLIAQEKTLHSAPQQQSFGEELTGILENLTSVASNFTPFTTPTSGKKRKCQWEDFENKENTDGSLRLRGIRLQNASFNPQFPEITAGETTDVFDENQSGVDNKNVSEFKDLSVGGIQDLAIWKDFTAILERKTPIKSKIFNFSSNFSSWQHPQTPVPFSSLGKNIATSDLVKGVNKTRNVVDLSDTPFFDQTPPLPSTSFSKMCDVSNPVTSSSDCSVSSSSASISTPQRMKDLQFVRQRLTTLRRSLK